MMWRISPRAAKLAAALFAAAFFAAAASAQDATYDALRSEGARFYSEGSFGLAYDAWSRAAELDVPEGDRRQLAFYTADARWRSGGAPDEIAAAREALEALADTEPPDAIAAEALESLGDSWWADLGGRNWQAAWPFYERALGFWAASSDIETARARYLGIVWKATGPPDEAASGINLPLEVLANALEVAATPEDRARAHYFLGVWYAARGGDAFALRRAGREFGAAVEIGRETAVYEAALFRLARWNLRAGASEWRPDGGLVVGPNYDVAVDLFRRFMREFPRGQSRFFDEAESEVAAITRPMLSLDFPSTFRPGERPRGTVRWRNLTGLDLGISRVDLADAFRPGKQTSPDDYLSAVRTDSAVVIRRWKESETVGQRHAIRERKLELEPIEEPGTYLVEAKSGAQAARALVVVTASGAILQAYGPRAVALVSDASTGLAPSSGVVGSLWRAASDGDDFAWERFDAEPGKGGLLDFALPDETRNSSGRLVLFATGPGGPAVAETYLGWYPGMPGAWRVQAITDRAAYRPGEAVEWKVLARKNDAGRWAVPDGEELAFKIFDPMGEQAAEGEVRLTAFGSAWGTFRPGESARLGEYRIEFSADGRLLGSETLCRIEEFKLPEFRVTASVEPSDGGRARLGDPVRASVDASYYFGGPVVDATVGLTVTEFAYHRVIPFPAAAPNFARRIAIFPPPRGPGRVIRSESMQTGPDGRAALEFQTPVDSRTDMEYEVEARVVDGSGREIVGTASLVVGRQGYFAVVQPSRRVVEPGTKIEISVEAEDGNGNPVETAGTLRVTRETWRETWVDPSGREVAGGELARLRQGVFPPEPSAGWRQTRARYESEEVATADLPTGADGEATFAFRPDSAGYFAFRWSGADSDGPPVVAETHVWSSTGAGDIVGYRSGGIEIIADPAASGEGGGMPVLVVADSSNRDILFTVGAGDRILRAEVLRLEGDSKLVRLEGGDAFVPNVFATAAGFRGLDFHADVRELAFPPVEHALSIEVEPSGASYLPGSDAEIAVRVLRADGSPARAELSLAVTDEAISYIEADASLDPLEFFYGTMRGDASTLTSSVASRPFWREVPEPEAEVSGREERRRSGWNSFADSDANEGSVSYGAALGGGGAIPMVAEPAVKQETADKLASGRAGEEAAAAPTDAVEVRRDFRATAFWKPNLVTSADGRARVALRFPDSLTTWSVVARGATSGSEFGMGSASVVTTKPLIARLQSPRFLVDGDSCMIRGVVNNRTAAAISARAALEATGISGTLKPVDLKIAPGEEAVASWRVEAGSTGAAELVLKAAGGEQADAMAREFPVVENGIHKSVATSGKLDGGEATFSIEIPAERRAGSESLTVTATGSIAAAMLDAIPYLIEYPYGCVEQTMSRFLPAAAVAKTLEGLGIDREDVAGRIFGGVGPARPGASDRQAPVAELEAVIETGLARLYDQQRDDGMWGWWKGGEADPWMSAYVVWGLRVAQSGGVAVRQAVVGRGLEALREALASEDGRPEVQAWMLHAVSAHFSPGGALSAEERRAFDRLWENRESLGSYGRALLALAAHRYGDTSRAETLARNLRDGVQLDEQPGVSAATGVGSPSSQAIPTAHWGRASGFLRWSESGVESTAFALSALLAIEPGGDLAEPAMNWLVKNRRGAQWSNTRDSAIALLALNDWLVASGELGGEVSFDITVNGERVASVDDQKVLDGVSRFEVDRALMVDGANEIVIRRTGGSGPVYFSAAAEFFTLESPIPAAGNELFAEREYFRYRARATLLDGYQFERVPWALGEQSAPNERIEAVVTLEAKNDLEYVIVEDLRPAGLEAVSVRSGEFARAVSPDGRELPVYTELRDQKAVFFLAELPQGTWKLRYDLRAETPGDFSALPTLGHAMYVPEIRCNGTSRRVAIGE